VALAIAWGLTAEGLRQTSVFVREVENNAQDANILLQIAAEPRFLLVTLPWLVILVIHMVRTLAGRRPSLESEIDRERRLAKSRTQETPKLKNQLEDTSSSPSVRLNSDGELTNSTVEAWGDRH
jgi:hypothetical protein